MVQLSELELQNLRHLIGGFETSSGKMKEYAKWADSQDVKQFFEKSAQSAQQNRDALMKFLQ
ncbi:MAG: hypothetical protein LUI10_11430 [Lachnospiraceae bacterium]|nr:hypothetical protein [Lachnospiraceae bacterium]